VSDFDALLSAEWRDVCLGSGHWMMMPGTNIIHGSIPTEIQRKKSLEGTVGGPRLSGAEGLEVSVAAIHVEILPCKPLWGPGSAFLFEPQKNRGSDFFRIN